MRMRRSCTSLKLASTHNWSSGTTDISGVPAATRWPNCTRAPGHQPATGAGSSVRCSARKASRTGRRRAARLGCCSTWCLRSAPGWRSAAPAPRPAPTARGQRTLGAGDLGSFGVLHILRRRRRRWPAAARRRATSSCARPAGLRRGAPRLSRSADGACSVPLLAYSVRTSRTVCASWPRRLLQGDAGVGCVQADQGLAGAHEVGVVGMDGAHGAGHLRRDLHHVARCT
jgi:hypothetical protein